MKCVTIGLIVGVLALALSGCPNGGLSDQDILRLDDEVALVDAQLQCRLDALRTAGMSKATAAAVRDLIEQRRKLVDTERRLRESEDRVVTVEQLMLLMSVYLATSRPGPHSHGLKRLFDDLFFRIAYWRLWHFYFNYLFDHKFFTKIYPRLHKWLNFNPTRKLKRLIHRYK